MTGLLTICSIIILWLGPAKNWPNTVYFCIYVVLINRLVNRVLTPKEISHLRVSPETAAPSNIQSSPGGSVLVDSARNANVCIDNTASRNLPDGARRKKSEKEDERKAHLFNLQTLFYPFFYSLFAVAAEEPRRSMVGNFPSKSYPLHVQKKQEVSWEKLRGGSERSKVADCGLLKHTARRR